MAIYVDPMGACVPNARWRWSENCHLFADTTEELIAFAPRIGLRPDWIQNADRPGRLLHFDLTRGMRLRALRHGAIPVPWGFLVERYRAAREAAPARQPPPAKSGRAGAGGKEAR